MSLRKPLIPYYKVAVVGVAFGTLLGAMICVAMYATGRFHPGPLIALPIVVWAVWSLVWLAFEWFDA